MNLLNNRVCSTSHQSLLRAEESQEYTSSTKQCLLELGSQRPQCLVRPLKVVRLLITATLLAAFLMGLSLIFIYFFHLSAQHLQSQRLMDALKKLDLFSRLRQPQMQPTEEVIASEFAKFERDYNRYWRSDEERASRMAIFRDNYLIAHELNKVGVGAQEGRSGVSTRFGVNSLADMSEEEFSKILMPKDHFDQKSRALRRKGNNTKAFIRPMSPTLARNIAADGDYPSHFDWRHYNVVTPVKWQGKCGSCWAFASVATVESAYAVAHGQLRNLSEQELLDCDLSNNACDGGDSDLAFHFVHKWGLVSELDYPYTAQRQNVCAVGAGQERTKIDVAYYINPDEDSIMDWLVNFGPVNVGIRVPPDMKPYRGGVYSPSDYDCTFRVVGTHSLLVVGYGRDEETDEKYWIVKNSWGQQWGIQSGYVNFARGINACGIEDEPVGLLA